MAKLDLNAATTGIRGKVDGWVYRVVNGQTMVSASRRAKARKPSAAQANQRKRFRAAQAYAADVLADPLKRSVYQKLGLERGRPPNALLISNFLTPPAIEAIELGAYLGRAGELIQILATDAIEVVDVTVRILNACGTEIESGPATADHGVWVYRTATSIARGTPIQIEVTARNRARTAATQTISR